MKLCQIQNASIICLWCLKPVTAMRIDFTWLALFNNDIRYYITLMKYRNNYHASLSTKNSKI